MIQLAVKTKNNFLKIFNLHYHTIQSQPRLRASGNTPVKMEYDMKLFASKQHVLHSALQKKNTGLPTSTSYNIIISFASFELLNYYWKGAPGRCNSATHRRRARTSVASYLNRPSPLKNKFNIVWTVGPRIRY